MASVTVTVELMGGPRDGHRLRHRRPLFTDMPVDIPDADGYRLGCLDTRVWPNVYRYEWQHPRGGARRGCSIRGCGPSCPSRRASRRKDTT